MGKVEIRISGNRADLEAMTAFLLDIQAVKKIPKLLYKSIYYPNRSRQNPGLRRYLKFLIESEEIVQDSDRPAVRQKSKVKSQKKQKRIQAPEYH